VNRARLVKLWPYATAIGVLILCVSVFVAVEWHVAWDLGSRVVAFVQAKWRALAIVFITVLALVIEAFFLSWEKTTLFRRALLAKRSSFLIGLHPTPLDAWCQSKTSCVAFLIDKSRALPLKRTLLCQRLNTW